MLTQNLVESSGKGLEATFLMAGSATFPALFRLQQPQVVNLRVLVMNRLAQAIPTFIVGTADLSPSVYMTWPGKVDFQSVSTFSPGERRQYLTLL